MPLSLSLSLSLRLSREDRSMVLPRKPGGDPGSLGQGTQSEFSFDSLQLPDSTQAEIFQAGKVADMVQAVLQGYVIHT